MMHIYLRVVRYMVLNGTLGNKIAINDGYMQTLYMIKTILGKMNFLASARDLKSQCLKKKWEINPASFFYYAHYPGCKINMQRIIDRSISLEELEMCNNSVTYAALSWAVHASVADLFSLLILCLCIHCKCILTYLYVVILCKIYFNSLLMYLHIKYIMYNV